MFPCAGGAGWRSAWCSFTLWRAEEQCGAAAAVWAAGPQPGGAARPGLRAPGSAAWHGAPRQSSAPKAAQQSHGQSQFRVPCYLKEIKISSLTLWIVFIIRGSFSSWAIILVSCSTWPRASQRAPSRGGRVWSPACRLRWPDCSSMDWRKGPGCRKHYRYTYIIRKLSLVPNKLNCRNWNTVWGKVCCIKDF